MLSLLTLITCSICTSCLEGGTGDHGHRSVGDGGGGDASPPTFQSGGDSIGIVPHTFQFRKIARHIA